MRTETIALPSGAAITLRQISLKEENYLAGALRSRRANQDKVLVDVVNRCCQGFEEPGPYPWAEGGGKVNWQEMLQGDLIAAMIGLRKLSYREGKDYEIDVKCPNRVCNHKFGYIIDLDKDLFFQKLSEESARKLREDETFTVKIGGKTVHFKLGYVKDDQFHEKLEKRFPGRGMATMLRTQIVRIDEVDSKDMMNWLDGEGNGPYEGLLADDAEDMREAFFAVDCGVDTEVEVECSRSACGNVFNMDLPFEGMLSPGRTMARKRKMRRQTEMRDAGKEGSPKPPDAEPEADSETSSAD